MDRGEKGKKKYDETNLIRVDGQGKTKKDICLAYIELIETDFSLTVEDVALYLRCTYQHVIDKIVPEVQHIRITEVGKIMLLEYAKDNELSEDLTPLFFKRILFHEGDFQRYICESVETIVAYKRFYEHDFKIEVVEKINEKISIYNQEYKRNLTLNQYMQRVMDSFLWKSFKNELITVPTIEDFPEKLYSQKDLIDLLGLNFKMEFYRKLDSLGLNKIKIGNMVRYRKDEVVEKFLVRMYITVFLYLKENYGEQYIQIIEERALELLD